MKIYIIEELVDNGYWCIKDRIAFKNKKEAEKKVILLNKYSKWEKFHISELKLK